MSTFDKNKISLILGNNSLHYGITCKFSSKGDEWNKRRATTYVNMIVRKNASQIPHVKIIKECPS